MNSLIIAEVLKFGLITWVNYMQQAGMTTAEIDAAYERAKQGMLMRDPAAIPDK